MDSASPSRPLLAVAALLAVGGLLFWLTREPAPVEESAAPEPEPELAAPAPRAPEIELAAPTPEVERESTGPPIVLPDPADHEPEPEETPLPPLLTLEPFTPRLEGRVVAEELEGGGPIAGARVVVTLARRPMGDLLYRGSLNGLPIATLVTGSDGRFTASLPIPEVETLVDLHVLSEGYLPHSMTAHWADLGELGQEFASPMIVLTKGEDFTARLEFPEGFSEADRESFRLLAVPDPGADSAPSSWSDAISVADDLSLGGLYPGWTASASEGFEFAEPDEHDEVVFTGWAPGAAHWLRCLHPGYLIEQPGPVIAGTGIQTLRVVRRPHVLFQLGGQDATPGSWRLEFDLQLAGTGDGLPLDVRSRAGGLHSTGSRIDLSLLPQTLGAPIDPLGVDRITGLLTAYLDPFSGGRAQPDSEWVLEQKIDVHRGPEGFVVPLALDQFEKRPTSDPLGSKVVYDQQKEQVFDAELVWVAPDGTRTSASGVFQPQHAGSSIVSFVEPRFPCRLEVSGSFAGRRTTWEAGYRDGDLVWLDRAPFLCPKAGTLRVRDIEDPFHPVQLAWRDSGGGEHIVWEGQLGSLREAVPMPSGVWVLASRENRRRYRLRVEPGRDTVSVF